MLRASTARYTALGVDVVVIRNVQPPVTTRAIIDLTFKRRNERPPHLFESVPTAWIPYADVQRLQRGDIIQRADGTAAWTVETMIDESDDVDTVVSIVERPLCP